MIKGSDVVREYSPEEMLAWERVENVRRRIDLLRVLLPKTKRLKAEHSIEFQRLLSETWEENGNALLALGDASKDKQCQP